MKLRWVAAVAVALTLAGLGVLAFSEEALDSLAESERQTEQARPSGEARSTGRSGRRVGSSVEGNTRSRAPLDQGPPADQKRLTDQDIYDTFERLSADPSDENLAAIVRDLKKDPEAAVKLLDVAGRLRTELADGTGTGMDLWAALFLVGQLKDPTAAAGLKVFAELPELSDSTAGVRFDEYRAKLQAVGSLGELGAVDALREMLSLESRLRGAVYVALAEAGQPEPGHQIIPTNEVIGEATPELLERVQREHNAPPQETPKLEEKSL